VADTFSTFATVEHGSASSFMKNIPSILLTTTFLMIVQLYYDLANCSIAHALRNHSDFGTTKMLSNKYEYKARECPQLFYDLLTFNIAQPAVSL
jgi:hypothetical protein